MNGPVSAQGDPTGMRVVIVEDDDTIRSTLALGLRSGGFETHAAPDGPSGLAMFYERRPDLVVLDLLLPGLDGISVCRAIRATHMTPVVMLTARAETEDVVAGLQAGADDYVVKPFEMRELTARLQAVLRRSAREPERERIELGDLEIDLASASARLAGRALTLTPTEYRLLVDLARHAGIVRSRDDLLSSVWGYSWSGDARLVDVHIQRLRTKTRAEAIETVRGIGYRIRR